MSEPTADRSRTELKSPGYEIFIGALSILSILNLILMYVISDENLDDVIFVINVLMSVIFLGDFLYRLFTSGSKSGYLLRQFGWADLLSCVPFPQAKVLRAFRLARIAEGLGRRGNKTIVRGLVKDRAGSALLTLLLMGILVLEFGSLYILHVEQYEEGANILTASDALWFVVVTISTVGYGDQFPVTDAGRVIGTIVIIIGVAIFGTFTGYLANLFLARAKQPPRPQAATPRGSAARDRTAAQDDRRPAGCDRPTRAAPPVAGIGATLRIHPSHPRRVGRSHGARFIIRLVMDPQGLVRARWPTPAGLPRQRHRRLVALVAIAAAVVVPTACGDPEDASLCTAFAEFQEARAAIADIDPATAAAASAADAEEVAQDYVDGVHRLIQAADGRYRQQLEELELAATDVLLTLSSVQDDADSATWRPLIEDDIEEAADAAAVVEDAIEPSCATATSET